MNCPSQTRHMTPNRHPYSNHKVGLLGFLQAYPPKYCYNNNNPMHLSQKGAGEFPQEAQLLPQDQLHPTDHSSCSQRNAKDHRQLFTSASASSTPASTPKKDQAASNPCPPFLPFKLTRSQSQDRKASNLDQEIDNYFRSWKEIVSNQKLEVVQTDLRSFILFQPTLKCPEKAKICLKFYNLVKKRGGFLEVLALNKFDQVVQELETALGLPVQHPRQLYFELYKKLILAFQLYKNHRLESKQPVNVGMVRFYSPSEVDRIIKQGAQNLEFDRDILVIEDFVNYVGYDTRILSAEYFNKKYGDTIVDTRIQRSDAYGFDVFASEMINDEAQMKFSDYIAYQELEGTPEVKKLPFSRQLRRNEVCFAVNVDLIEKEDIQREIHSKLHKVKFVQYVNELDALSYCEQWIPGCNHPQLYFKVNGVWTGGHQENVAMSSVNINCGPDSSEWYSLDVEHVPRLRNQVLQEFGVDIIEHEGLWFVHPEWMIIHNYPIKKLIQKKGDLVYSGPGTLHWVRSLGKCFQVAWNVFPKTQKQWKQATTRMRINQEIHFKHVFMPLKQLAIKILNHEYYKRTPFVEAVEKSLVEWVKQEAQLINAYVDKGNQLSFAYRKLADVDSLCQKCRNEVLTLYSLDTKGRTVCFRCYAQEEQNKSNGSLYIKNRQEDLKKLLQRVKRFREEEAVQRQPEIESLCGKKYCGVVECSRASKLQALDRKQSAQLLKTGTKDTLQQSISNEAPKPCQQVRQKAQEIPIHLGTITHYQMDALELLKLLSTCLPKCSWSSTEEVIEAQQRIIRESGYLPVKRLKLTIEEVPSSSFRTE